MFYRCVIQTISIILSIICSGVLAVDLNLSGRVLDSQGSPVPGVLVYLQGIRDSSVTGADGSFAMADTGVQFIKEQNIRASGPVFRLTYHDASGRVSFTLQQARKVSICLYDLEGARKDCALDRIMDRGTHSMDLFNLVNVPLTSSMYLVRFEAGGGVGVLKAVKLGVQRQGFAAAREGYKGNALAKKTAVLDSLRFEKDGYQSLSMGLDTLEADLGDVEIYKHPSCAITNPAGGAEFSFGDSITVAAEAQDDDGTIASVALYINGEPAAVDDAPPYEFVWPSWRHTVGERVLTAVAADDDGLTGADSVSVTVTSQSVRAFTCSVRNEWPHDPEAFTQGLIYEDGLLYEGTGLRGQSSLRKVELETGSVLQQHDLADVYFGEGITKFAGRIIQITWQENIAFVYNWESFALLDSFPVATEGWGITHDGEKLIISDGSSSLFFRDPDTYEETGSLSVTSAGSPVMNLNELEYFHHKVFANVWMSDDILMIDPSTGSVLGRIDAGGLLSPTEAAAADVLNGIAYDGDNDRIMVTGKLWPKLFEVEITPGP
ncbi:glutaminyl-peptide cyclotransferase [Fibrobacterota bacterium]